MKLREEPKDPGALFMGELNTSLGILFYQRAFTENIGGTGIAGSISKVSLLVKAPAGEYHFPFQGETDCAGQ